MHCPRWSIRVTGRVHASFNQVVTATGRLSSSDPNLQNIPVRRKWAAKSARRSCLASRAGSCWRPIIHKLNCEFWPITRAIKGYARPSCDNQDIHTQVAAEVNNLPLEEVTEAMRRQAKVVNFGVIYGQAPRGWPAAWALRRWQRLVSSTPISRATLESRSSWFAYLAEARQKGYVHTILGRRRAIAGIRQQAGRSRNLAERTAVNTVIQGSAADLIKLAMIAIHKRLRQERLAARMLLQIHDELIFEAPAEELSHLALLVGEEMAGAEKLRSPPEGRYRSGPQLGRNATAGIGHSIYFLFSGGRSHQGNRPAQVVVLPVHRSSAPALPYRFGLEDDPQLNL